MAAALGPQYDSTAYPPFAVTVDLAVFTIRRDALQVLLIERGGEPFGGALALPGGFVQPDEDLSQAAARELAEETGLGADAEAWHLEQLASYGAPDRDPRMRVVTVAYLALCADLPAPRHGGDAAAAVLTPVEEIERGAARLAFDHERIVKDAVERTRSKLEYTALAAKLCPPAFTIGQLRRVYEVVWGERLYPGNFHRDFRASGAFERRGGSEPASWSQRGRPAALWSVRHSTDSDPFATPLERPLARRKRSALRRAPADGEVRLPQVPSRPGAPSPPRREYAALLREAVEGYDYPRVVYDFRTESETCCEDMLGVEECIGALLRSRAPERIRDGLSNVLFWGYARQPRRRDAKVRDFRGATPVGDPRLGQFAELVGAMGERPRPEAGGSELLGLKRLRLRQFGQMSFATKILMFLDPRFPVLDLKVAKAFASGGFAPLSDLRFDKGGIRITRSNMMAYQCWARWCQEIARLTNEEPPSPRRGLRAVDVERALFTIADRPDRRDRARRLLDGPEGWTFDCT